MNLSRFKIRKTKSIQFLITQSFIFVTIITLIIVSMIMYNKFLRISENNLKTTSRQVVNQVNNNLDFYIQSMMEISDSIVELVSNSNENSTEHNAYLSNEINVVLKSRKDLVSISIFSKSGNLIIGAPNKSVKNNLNILTQDWFQTPITQPSTLFFSSPHVENIFENQHNWVVSLSREITYNISGIKYTGILLVDMNFSAIDSLCQNANLGKRGYVYIVDSNNNLVYHPKQQLINAGLKSENLYDVEKNVFGTYFDNFNNEKRLIIIETVNNCRWRIVGVVYQDDIVKVKDDIFQFILILSVIAILIVVIISALISAKISKPIKTLEKSMIQLKEGDFDVSLNIKGEKEVVNLANTFNIMVIKIKNLMQQILVEQESKRKSDLNALQSQINPHFLYNTLDSIVWMAENKKTLDVITMVTALAKLFRISISRGKNIISVKEEIEHAKNYLIIQNVRYKNKFTYEFEISEDTLKLKTLKLILQPLIENAIYHGIEYMVDEGEIQIKSSIKNNRLLLEIIDNGLGIASEKIENILTIEENPSKGSGVGLKNVHERIQLCYGKEFGLDIHSELEEGTHIKIWLPIEEGE